MCVQSEWEVGRAVLGGFERGLVRTVPRSDLPLVGLPPSICGRSERDVVMLGMGIYVGFYIYSLFTCPLHSRFRFWYGYWIVYGSLVYGILVVIGILP